jgi:hypothetical protein
MSASRAIVGWLLAAAMTAGTVALSRVPFTAAPGEDGELRLAWRWRSERIENCRRLSAEELAKRPAHMRSAVACERGLRPYRLEMWVDGRLLVSGLVQAKGAESDRPLSVFRQVPLAPGRYAVRVAFTPLAAATDSSLPPPLVLDSTLVVAPRQVVLLTMDTDRGVLVARTN